MGIVELVTILTGFSGLGLLIVRATNAIVQNKIELTKIINDVNSSLSKSVADLQTEFKVYQASAQGESKVIHARITSLKEQVSELQEKVQVKSLVQHLIDNPNSQKP